MRDAKWKSVAEVLDLDIPQEHLEPIIPILEELYRGVRPALDRDLSTTDPVFTFRPDGA